DIAGELNPQLHKDLEVLMTSPPLIPAVFFFRPGYKAVAQREFEAAILQLHTTTAGQQVLIVFQGSRMEKYPLSAFDDTRHLLSQSQQTVKREGAEKTVGYKPVTQSLSMP